MDFKDAIQQLAERIAKQKETDMVSYRRLQITGEN